MTQDRVRIGIVGAGANTRLRHIPGFQAIEGVEVVSVSNRNRESGQRVADEFGIPRVYDHWTEVISDAETDAICIGTWPYLHCPITVAALEAGKHVMTEARMAMDATQARSMLDASRRRPDLVAQIVPSPMTLKFDMTIKELIAEGYLGEVLAIEVRGPAGAFAENDGKLHWRHDRGLSGYNVLTMGIWYEALMRWVGPATTVVAMTAINVAQRRNGEGRLEAVSVPDHVDVLCKMACGAQAHLSFSSVTGLARVPEVWLFGSEGTIHLDGTAGGTVLRGGRRGDKKLEEIDVLPEKQRGWRVEEEFVNAIRGVEKISHTTFGDGAAYMEFTEAVTRSAQAGSAVSLPL